MRDPSKGHGSGALYSGTTLTEPQLPPANKCWVAHFPDFLRRLVALIHPMRLSLMKGAHADLSSTAWQEIGVKPSFGLSGIVTSDALQNHSGQATAGIGSPGREDLSGSC